MNDDEALSADLILSPSPAGDELKITTNLNLQEAFFSIYDLSGRRIMTNALNNTKTIDVSQLSTGNYILSIMSGTTIKNQKFVKN